MQRSLPGIKNTREENVAEMLEIKSNVLAMCMSRPPNYKEEDAVGQAWSVK